MLSAFWRPTTFILLLWIELEDEPAAELPLLPVFEDDCHWLITPWTEVVPPPALVFEELPQSEDELTVIMPQPELADKESSPPPRRPMTGLYKGRCERRTRGHVRWQAEDISEFGEKGIFQCVCVCVYIGIYTRKVECVGWTLVSYSQRYFQERIQLEMLEVIGDYQQILKTITTKEENINK